jgi:hypothetical protein
VVSLLEEDTVSDQGTHRADTAPDRTRLNEALLEAAHAGSITRVRQFLDLGADVNARTRDGWSVLLAAVEHDLELVRELIRRGADLNVASDHGYTPLMRAAGKGREDVVTLLLEEGADPFAKDVNGMTAYQLAMEATQFDCAELVGDVLAQRIVSELEDDRRREGFLLRPLTSPERVMVSMSRGSFGGSVTRLFCEFEDGTRSDGLRLIEELVVEMPLADAEKPIETIGVPFEQG